MKNASAGQHFCYCTEQVYEWLFYLSPSGAPQPDLEGTRPLPTLCCAMGKTLDCVLEVGCRFAGAAE